MSSNSIFLNTSLFKTPGLVGVTQSLNEIMSLPSGLQQDDLMILMVSSSASGNAPTSTGWTTGNSGTYGAMTYAWYWKYYESGDTLTLDVDNNELKICAAFRNVDPIYPFDTTSVIATGATGDPNAPSITTVTPMSFVVALGYLDDDNTAITVPTGYTLIANQIDDQANSKGSVAMAYKEIKVPGAEDPPTFGGTGTDEWVAISIALRPLAASVPMSATGGTTYISDGYKYHKFTANGDFIVSSLGSQPTLEILAIAGGGGGASGGGGAGGVKYSTFTPSASTYAIVIGGGGSSSGSTTKASSGTNSTFNSTTVSATGGGGGGGSSTSPPGNRSGANGGSGGGGGFGNTAGGSGTSGEGYAGGTGGTFSSGGGGGAGGVGENANTDGTDYAGDGGLGTNSYSTWATATSSGENGYFASGGYGNGTGGTRSDGSGVNTGGGGNTSTSGNSGIVIVRYRTLNGTLG